MNKLKIGLLLDSALADKYVFSLLDWAKAQDNLDVSAVIVCQAVAPSQKKRFSGTSFASAFHDLISGLFFSIVISVEKIFLRFNKTHRSHLAKFDLKEMAGDRVLLYLPVTLSKNEYHLSEKYLAHITALKLDLFIQCGTNKLARKILGAASLGTIALDYHGKRSNLSVPPGFWETYGKTPKTEFEICHHALRGDGSEVLVRGSFPTKFLFLLNQANLYSKSNAQLKSLLNKVASSRCLPVQESSRPYSGRPLTQPGFHQSAAYLMKIGFRLAAKIFYKIFNIRQKWGISFIHASWRNAALWRSQRITAPRGHFWADPFLYSHNDKTYCFVEDFVYKTGRGHIVALELTDNGAVELGVSIKEDFHLSFPFLFRHGGELFMCPESSEARQIRIYRCTSFPLEWELCSIAMEDVSAADSMFFEHDDRWWMLTNIDRSGLDDHCSELYLFHSSSPFDNNWIPHPKNPLRIDAEGGRNAGLILEDGRIFRAAQRQGFDQYGKGLLLYEITDLTESVYSEYLVTEIDCNFRRGLLGSHHLSTTGKITVFDHVGRCFFP
jgi:hypothetical protein